MKKIINDPFTILLPHLDLHGETYETMEYQINSFIKDNYLLKNERVVIIHGRSGNVLKRETQNVLKNNSIVKNYFIDPSNDGQTIVEIKMKEN